MSVWFNQCVSILFAWLKLLVSDIQIRLAIRSWFPHTFCYNRWNLFRRLFLLEFLLHFNFNSNLKFISCVIEYQSNVFFLFSKLKIHLACNVKIMSERKKVNQMKDLSKIHWLLNKIIHKLKLLVLITDKIQISIKKRYLII